MKAILSILIFLTLANAEYKEYQVNHEGMAITPYKTKHYCKPLKKKVYELTKSKDLKELTLYERAQIMLWEYQIKNNCLECRIPYSSVFEE